MPRLAAIDRGLPVALLAYVTLARAIKVSDRVCLSFNIACGFCKNGQRGSCTPMAIYIVIRYKLAHGGCCAVTKCDAQVP